VLKGSTYADVYAMLGDGNTIAWLTETVAVCRGEGRAYGYSDILDNVCSVYFYADGKNMVALARSPEALLEISDSVLRLLTVSAVHQVEVWGTKGESSYSHFAAPSLAYLMEQCQDLKALTLYRLRSLDETYCRVLGTYSRPDLEINFIACTVTTVGTRALTEVLGRNQGPTKILGCAIDNSVLANGLRGNSRLQYLSPHLLSNRDDGNQNLLVIADALKENKGLVDLDLTHDFTMTDETWDAVCDSLKTHPTLEVLNLRSIQTFEDPLDPAVIMSRIQALVDMLKANMSLHTIYLSIRYREKELYRGSVIPYLETNRLRPRLLAIQKALPIPYRVKVLGRALLAVRTDPNHFWMLLSNNAEVAFPSTRTATTPTANLPTPASTVSADNAYPVASTVLPAANVAALASGQKRKACP
jgi:hypothetical protein